MRGKWFIVPLIALPLLIGGAWMWDRDWAYPYVALILPIDAEPAAAIPELVLEEKIALGDVKGRIDHLAIDLKRGRLFIAELGNNSVGVVDLKNHRAETRLTGFVEPQGIAYVPGPDKVFIANAGDGTVSFRSGHDLSQTRQIALGDDADNIRLDGPDRVIVGYGSGGLVVLDGASGEKLENISLAAHPESFQIDPGGSRIFVNELKALKIAVVDRRSGKEISSWGAAAAAANFPMAFDSAERRLFVAYRLPALIAAFDTQTGKLIDRRTTCGDADDVFHDKSRSRLYVICGDGSVAVLDVSKPELRELSRLQTKKGARTGLYVPDLDRLFVAAPMRGRQPAQVWVYKPSS
jgi:hypothetical protein